MNFVYYIVRKKDNVILDGAEDVVSAINMAQKEECACFILQACVITEVGQDLDESVISEENIENVLEPETITKVIE